MNNNSKARVAQLSQPCQDKANAMDTQLSAEWEGTGYTFEVIQGGRSYNMQAAYYSQGREPLDQVNAKRAAVQLAPITDQENQKTVTDAPPGYSYHQFFMALDGDVFLNGEPIWNTKDAHFQRMIAVGRSVGFNCGADWTNPKGDDDHFQDTGRFPAEPTDEVRQLFTGGGMVSVWKEAYETS